MKAWSSGENVSFTSFFDIMAVNKTFHPPKYPLDRERFPAELPVALIYPQPGLQTALISRTWPRNKPSMSDWILLGCCLLVGPTNKNIFPKLVLCLKNMVIYYGTMRKTSPIAQHRSQFAHCLVVSHGRWSSFAHSSTSQILFPHTDSMNYHAWIFCFFEGSQWSEFQT